MKEAIKEIAIRLLIYTPLLLISIAWFMFVYNDIGISFTYGNVLAWGYILLSYNFVAYWVVVIVEDTL